MRPARRGVLSVRNIRSSESRPRVLSRSFRTESGQSVIVARPPQGAYTRCALSNLFLTYLVSFFLEAGFSLCLRGKQGYPQMKVCTNFRLFLGIELSTLP